MKVELARRVSHPPLTAAIRLAGTSESDYLPKSGADPAMLSATCPRYLPSLGVGKLRENCVLICESFG